MCVCHSYLYDIPMVCLAIYGPVSVCVHNGLQEPLKTIFTMNNVGIVLVDFPTLYLFRQPLSISLPLRPLRFNLIRYLSALYIRFVPSYCARVCMGRREGVGTL